MAFSATQGLNSLTTGPAQHHHRYTLHLDLAPGTGHLKRERVLAGEIFCRAVNRDERRYLEAEALLEVGGPQPALLHGHLSVGGWCHEPNDRQGSRGAVLADRREDACIDICVRLASDLTVNG